MAIAPPCPCPDRTPVDVSCGINSAAKVKSGKVNASDPLFVGDGAVVSEALLDGAPLSEAEWYGYFRDIEVVAAYPVSEWVPATPTEDGYWRRTRTAKRTWTRSHTGDQVIPMSSSPTFTDGFEEEGFDLGEDEAIIPGKDDDPDNYGEGHISLIDSLITASSEVGKEDLIEYSNTGDIEEWTPWIEIAQPVFRGLEGPAGGIVLYGGYEDSDKPHSIDRCDVRWCMSAYYSNALPGAPAFPGSGVSAPFISEPGLIFKASAKTRFLDERDPAETIITAGSSYSPTLAWRGDFWSNAVSLVDPDEPGWADLNGSDLEPGVIAIIEPYLWSIDVGLMLRR